MSLCFQVIGWAYELKATEEAGGWWSDGLGGWLCECFCVCEQAISAVR